MASQGENTVRELDQRPVVVGYDGSASSNQALQWAADAALRRGLPLDIVCAAWPRRSDSRQPAPDSDAHQLLERAETEAQLGRPGLRTSSRFVDDTSTSALINASDAASLVVVGSRGHGGFHDLMLGSTSLHTAMYAHCTAAVIRPVKPPTAASEPSVGRVVVGVDGSPLSQPALEFAFDHADRTGRGLTAVHSWRGAITADPIGVMYGPGSDEEHRRAEALVADVVAPWHQRFPQADIRTVTPQMSAAEALVQQSMGADLVVIGSRGLGGFTGLLLGSAGQALIHQGGCPVVIAHRQPD